MNYPRTAQPTGAISGGLPMRANERAADGLIVPRAGGAVNLWADGLCEPRNPGGWACWGWYAQQDGQRVGEGRGCLGHGPDMTNNRAEYQAAIEALRWAAGEGLHGVTLHMDSQLVVNQATGAWQCKAAHLWPLLVELRALMAATDARLEWVPRERNARADQLSRNAWADASRAVRP